MTLPDEAAQYSVVTGLSIDRPPDGAKQNTDDTGFGLSSILHLHSAPSSTPQTVDHQTLNGRHLVSGNRQRAAICNLQPTHLSTPFR
jgi:hypothetical protein